jgi:ABC-type dipeptide/oligopeptide/nickel transport system ATPase component
MPPLLQVNHLTISFPHPHKTVMNDLCFTINAQDSLGIVGESGSGKTISMLSLLQLLPHTAQVSGEAWFNGQNLLALSPKAIQSVRGKAIAFVFQDARAALNPFLKIKTQLIEVLRLHQHLSLVTALQETLALLYAVELEKPEHVLNLYPHQCSGGMCQRILIALCLACKPQLLIADEPTSALDVIAQRQLITLIQKVMHQFDMTLIIISHDFGVISELCTTVMVLYKGTLVEQDSTEKIFTHPQHPYTQQLVAAIPISHSMGF